MLSDVLHAFIVKHTHVPSGHSQPDGHLSSDTAQHATTTRYLFQCYIFITTSKCGQVMLSVVSVRLSVCLSIHLSVRVFVCSGYNF